MHKEILEINFFKKLKKEMQTMLNDVNTINEEIKKILLINEELMQQVQNYVKRE